MKSLSIFQESWHLLLVIVGVCWNSAQVHSHVTLTFPAARQYGIDFLDNQRTNPPCGMIKGDTLTTLISGSTFNVTWQMGLMHEGGYRIELLAQNDAIKIMDLTTWAASKNSSKITESQRVTLPKGFICRNCTIRLRRQATEFGEHYIFWSCSDVDIVESTGGPSAELNCQHNDKHSTDDTDCQCEPGWTGTNCHLKTECETDEDCGGRKGIGKCIFVGLLLSDKVGQCYCARPYFGEKCSKSNNITLIQDNLPTMDSFDQSLYKNRNLSDEYKMFHRVLGNTEVEFVLVINGTSFGALGWRPLGLSKSCKSSWPAPRREIERHSRSLRKKLNRDRIESLEDSNQDDYTLVDNFVLESLFLQIDPGVQVYHGSKIITHEIPNAPFKAMDCTDIVVGTVIGNYSRIRDYYTMDRSTPQLDTFWGGQDDITGATGWETEHETTIVFRKRLRSTDFVDHDLTGELQMIWSKGQEHFDTNLDAKFYAKDDLKYHGYGSKQRGFTKIDLFKD